MHFCLSDMAGRGSGEVWCRSGGEWPQWSLASQLLQKRFNIRACSFARKAAPTPRSKPLECLCKPAIDKALNTAPGAIELISTFCARCTVAVSRPQPPPSLVARAAAFFQASVLPPHLVYGQAIKRLRRCRQLPPPSP